MPMLIKAFGLLQLVLVKDVNGWPDIKVLSGNRPANSAFITQSITSDRRGCSILCASIAACNYYNWGGTICYQFRALTSP